MDVLPGTGRARGACCTLDVPGSVPWTPACAGENEVVMSMAVIRTKAETALADSFAAVAARLPGGRAVADARKAAADRFVELGLPHRRIEEWKYTDLRNALREALPPSVGDATRLTIADLIVALGPLYALETPRIVFVNGAYRKELSALDKLEGIEVKPLSAALAEAQDTVGEALVRSAAGEGDAVVALNTAFATDGAIVRIAQGAQVEAALQIVFLRAGPEARSTSIRNVISVGREAAVTLVEAHVALPGCSEDGLTNAVTEIVIGDGARVTHAKCTLDRGKATHLANWMVSIGADADYRGFQLTGAVGLARNQILATLKGERSKLDLSGAFLARKSQHIDTTLTVDHAVPGCESRELFKGVLDGEARGVFQGKIIVRPDAQKTDGKQMAQALLLSPVAEFDSKPELEIFADDVACGHGSTTAGLDDDLLFYCKSRGIPEAEARALLVEAFIGEAIDKVEHEATRSALVEIARQWLAGKA